ncbi:MAG: MraY family glycosyltransferase [Planctomycetota bacterium]|nr:MraY family glycosyltransferase [Planctomycetota bacterium]MDA1105845.1 MraY family glycosyltransferase [Planctomycetota bacterium]
MTPASISTDDLPLVSSALDLLNACAPAMGAAFVVALIATPIARRMAVHADVIDRPDEARKLHSYPIAYLGGLGVFAGVIAGFIVSYAVAWSRPDLPEPIPWTIVAGLVAIFATGLADDVWSIDPRLKVAGQLIAAALLSMTDIGIPLGATFLEPLFGPSSNSLGIGAWGLVADSFPHYVNAAGELTMGSLYALAGTGLVAVLILGGCNAANLIDGLDGLLAGSTAIMAIGFVTVGLAMAVMIAPGIDDGSHTIARVIVPLVLLGAVLGFLPWNFNPAVIFLGDAGSLTIGYLCMVSVLLLAQPGKAAYGGVVVAGLIIFGLPILDTVAAIVRRKMAGLPISAPDANHIHHVFKRELGGVKPAVFAMWGLSAFFTIVGTGLALLYLFGYTRILVVYIVFGVVFCYAVVMTVKGSRLAKWSTEHTAVPKDPVGEAPGDVDPDATG